MNFYKLIHLIFGQCLFSVESKSFPRLANLLSAKKINFWGASYQSQSVKFYASVFTADKIVLYANQSHVPITLCQKSGLPFLFSKYCRRYGLIAGMAVALFLMFFAQLFVWKIDISGNKTVSRKAIEDALAQCNVSVGGFIPHINAASAENNLLLSYKALSSAAISIKGNRITVSVLERTPTPSIVNTKGYYNVVATHDGIILDIDAAEGSPEVAVGDVVYKGQLLINSFIEGKYGSVRPTHARGNVYAAVNQQIKIEIPLQTTVKNYTGEVQTKTVYDLLGLKLPTFISELTDYSYFDAVSATESISLFGVIELPLRKTKTTYTQYTLKQVRITPEQAKAKAEAQLRHIINDYNAPLLSCQTRFVTDEIKGVCTLYANATLKLNIACEKILNINQSSSDKLPSAKE